MKKIFYLAVLILAAACNNNTPTAPQAGDNENGESIKVVERDISIAPGNAYNNFFLDTSALSHYLQTKNISGNESLRILNFYNRRNFQYAWFTNDGLTAELRNFWNTYSYRDTTGKKTKTDKKLSILMDDLLTSTDTLNISPGDTIYANAEISVTRKFLSFMENSGDESLVTRLLPVKQFDPVMLAKLILEEKRDTGNLTKIEKQYDALGLHLKQIIENAARGKNDSIPFSGRLKKGSSSPAVAIVKRKLTQSGFLTGSDTGSVFTATLSQAVKAWQKSQGIKADGVVTDSLVRLLNTTGTDEIARIIVNMNRLLWLPKNLPVNYILVNIPEFMLHAYEGENIAFNMAVVVGREGTGTMMFSGDMDNVVFSPYWNVPASIVKKDIVPGMAKNSNYLESHHMEITGKTGGLPVVRQLPGPDNSLGRVKFLFPNTYDIYLHDTNAKQLFNRDNRAFSHGCIRLEDAEKMANYVLRNDTSWTSEKIKEAMDSQEEKWVKLKNTEPVVITYITTWVNDNGAMTTMPDIYGHDAKAISKLFKPK